MATRLKVLITAFEPFAGLAENPSEAVARKVVARSLPAADLSLCVLPVEYHEAMAQVRRMVAHYDAVIMLGFARKRKDVCLERVALNFMDASHPDNAGFQPIEESILPAGPVAYISSLPLKAWKKALTAAGLSASVSNSAGTYVCNAVYYAALHEIEQQALPTRALFIHIPPTESLPDASQTVEKVILLLSSPNATS